MPIRRRVNLLLEHSLVRRADRVLRTAEYLRADLLSLTERELGDRAADASFDAFRAVRDLVVAFALAPLLRAVGVADRHAHDRDRCVDAAERHDARNAPARPHDHAPTDLFAEDPVRRTDVVAPLGSDGRGLQAETVVADRLGRLVDDGVLGRAARLDRQVEAGKVELE